MVDSHPESRDGSGKLQYGEVVTLEVQWRDLWSWLQAAVGARGVRSAPTWPPPHHQQVRAFALGARCLWNRTDLTVRYIFRLFPYI